MAITEESRHQLDRRLEEVLVHEEATVMMEHLPPVGWADVATRRDLDTLEARFDLKLDALEARLEATLERSLREQSNRFFLGMGAMLTVLFTVQQVVAATLD
jgi:hypothetical protein